MSFAASAFRRLAICGLGLATLLSGCASSGGSNLFGQSEISDNDKVFLLAAGNWDRNKDGIVTCDEWKAYATELFDGADVGKKGYLTPDDWKRVVAVDKMFVTIDFKYYDVDKDGKVERAEFVDRTSRAFELADRDHDCDLTSVELTGARTAGAPPKSVVPAGSESGTSKPGPAGR